MSYSLEVSGFELEIEIAEIDDLKLHEEVLESYLLELADSIKESGEIRDPVIVDRGSGAVLDGMHRVTAMSHLEYDKMPVCFVDYEDPKLNLGSWCRIYEDLPEDRALELCKSSGFDLEKYDRGQALESINKGLRRLFLITPSESFLLASDKDEIKKIFDLAVEIEEAFGKMGYKPTLVSEKKVLEEVESGKIAIMIPPAKKEEVIKVSCSDGVFPPKMTRHVIPARPLRVNVPLGLLEEDIQIADEKITEKLKGRKTERLPPGSTFEGRDYEEELVIFKD